MYCVYVLQSERTGGLYVGSTSNLDRRLSEHNSNLATATKNRGPWRLIYRESCASRGDAMRRERYFKTGKGREEIHQLPEFENLGQSKQNRQSPPRRNS
ncbi:MAG: GIY-YIG nuclease family protein [Acidobacteriota bacterium]|nr:GIY-YIG nuclease family protein [Acidobacteriota bacterium]